MKRLVVVESLYHCGEVGTPTNHDTRFNRILATDEQPYSRIGIQLTEQWQPLQTGWLKDASMLVLTNLKAERRTLTAKGVPNPVQALLPDKTGWVEVGLAFTGLNDEIACQLPFAHLPPGETLRFSPTNLNQLLLRCAHGTARCNLLLLPE